MVIDCTEEHIHLRNLCRSCYLFAASLVRFGLTTWLQLETNGAVGPATGAIQSPKRPMRTEWFARGAGMTPDVLSNELRRLSTEYTHRRLGTKRRKKGSYGSATG